MRTLRGRVALVVGLIALSVASAHAAGTIRGSRDPRPASPGAQAAALHALFDREWDRGLRENPISASDQGDHRFDDRWPDVSPSAIERSHGDDEKALADLRHIDRSKLSESDRVSYDLFEWRCKDALDSYRFHEYLFPINQLGGIQTAGDMASQSLRFHSLADYRAWIARLRGFGGYMRQTIALLQRGVDEKRVMPKVVADRIPRQIDANIVSDPTKSPFYAPFADLPDSMAAGTAAALRADASAAIVDTVVPAYRQLKVFFHDTLLPHARTALAVTTLPDGEAYYAYLVQHFTTTDLTPKQVHDLGVQKMAEIRARMDQVIVRSGFHGTFAEFLHFLRTDPRFYYTKPGDLLAAYKTEAKTIDPLLVPLFGRLPRIPWGISVIPDDQAPNTYPAYSNPPSGDGRRAAYMAVNLYKPETRPKYEIPVLTCHEGRPGHALQLSIAAEMTSLPNFRRFGYFNAYGEGWALYSETLGWEMGLYADPYDEFGALSYQMWRAVRLVVDTGLHEYGMTREQAVQMFRDNTALNDQNIDTEVDRYIVWPGQALSYMIGEIRIQELRARAEKRLGSRFDLRGFHDVILENGTVPLSVLDSIVNGWIERRAREAPLAGR